MPARLAEARLATARLRAADGVAIGLGYFDQAHFVNDFTSMVGRPPSDYARSLTPR
jgi:AraC-like DNA-binding protein